MWIVAKWGYMIMSSQPTRIARLACSPLLHYARCVAKPRQCHTSTSEVLKQCTRLYRGLCGADARWPRACERLAYSQAWTCAIRCGARARELLYSRLCRVRRRAVIRSWPKRVHLQDAAICPHAVRLPYSNVHGAWRAHSYALHFSR